MEENEKVNANERNEKKHAAEQKKPKCGVEQKEQARPATTRNTDARIATVQNTTESGVKEQNLSRLKD